MCTKTLAIQIALACALSMSGCGGGGGGGGGGFESLGITDAAGVSPPGSDTGTGVDAATVASGEQAATSPLGKLTINGAGASPDAHGVYQLATGDRIEVDVPKATTLHAQTSEGANVSAHMVGKSGQAVVLDFSHYSARLWNERDTEADYVMTFKNASGDVLASYKFHLAAGDHRNGEYLLFSTSGQSDAMAVNFDRLDYKLNRLHAGSFEEDANDKGNFILGSMPPGAKQNVARMRYDKDVLVGALPKDVIYNRPAGQPFVAVRKVDVAASDLPTAPIGVVSYFRAKDGSLGMSYAQMFRIQNQGREVVVCRLYFDSSECRNPATFQIRPLAAPGFFEARHPTDAKTHMTFQAAIVGGEVILLNAVSDSFVNGFEIGLPLRQPWERGVARSHSTLGSQGSLEADIDSMTYDLLAEDGTRQLLSIPFLPLLDGEPRIRKAIEESGSYWGMQSQVLSVLARGDSLATPDNFLQIGLRR